MLCTLPRGCVLVFLAGSAEQLTGRGGRNREARERRKDRLCPREWYMPGEEELRGLGARFQRIQPWEYSPGKTCAFKWNSSLLMQACIFSCLLLKTQAYLILLYFTLLHFIDIACFTK